MALLGLASYSISKLVTNINSSGPRASFSDLALKDKVQDI